jgi:hypothetical protein
MATWPSLAAASEISLKTMISSGAGATVDRELGYHRNDSTKVGQLSGVNWLALPQHGRATVG